MADVHALRLSHFSAERIGRVDNRAKLRVGPSKPRGFWISVDGDDDWESWCLGEEFALSSLAIRHRVVLSPTARILYLDTVAALDAFSTEYTTPAEAWRMSLDWERLRETHDGIIIAPYQWERRFTDHTNWYYGWDCASGCLWRAEAVASIEVVADLMRDAA